MLIYIYSTRRLLQEDMPRSLSIFTFVMHAPSDYFYYKNAPYRKPYARRNMKINSVRTCTVLHIGVDPKPHPNPPSRAVDPHSFFAEPDPAGFFLMRIQLGFFSFESESSYCFNAKSKRLKFACYLPYYSKFHIKKNFENLKNVLLFTSKYFFYG